MKKKKFCIAFFMIMFVTLSIFTIFNVSKINYVYAKELGFKRGEIVLSSPVGGTTTGEGYYTYGEEATLSATPYDGYKFLNWIDESTGDILSTEQKTTITITKPTQVKAVFEECVYSYSLKDIVSKSPEEFLSYFNYTISKFDVDANDYVKLSNIDLKDDLFTFDFNFKYNDKIKVDLEIKDKVYINSLSVLSFSNIDQSELDIENFEIINDEFYGVKSISFEILFDKNVIAPHEDDNYTVNVNYYSILRLINIESSNAVDINLIKDLFSLTNKNGTSPDIYTKENGEYKKEYNSLYENITFRRFNDEYLIEDGQIIQVNSSSNNIYKFNSLEVKNESEILTTSENTKFTYNVHQNVKLAFDYQILSYTVSFKTWLLNDAGFLDERDDLNYFDFSIMQKMLNPGQSIDISIDKENQTITVDGTTYTKNSLYTKYGYIVDSLTLDNTNMGLDNTAVTIPENDPKDIIVGVVLKKIEYTINVDLNDDYFDSIVDVKINGETLKSIVAKTGDVVNFKLSNMPEYLSFSGWYKDITFKSNDLEYEFAFEPESDSVLTINYTAFIDYQIYYTQNFKLTQNSVSLNGEEYIYFADLFVDTLTSIKADFTSNQITFFTTHFYVEVDSLKTIANYKYSTISVEKKSENDEQIVYYNSQFGTFTFKKVDGNIVSVNFMNSFFTLNGDIFKINAPKDVLDIEGDFTRNKLDYSIKISNLKYSDIVFYSSSATSDSFSYSVMFDNDSPSTPISTIENNNRYILPIVVLSVKTYCVKYISKTADIYFKSSNVKSFDINRLSISNFNTKTNIYDESNTNIIGLKVDADDGTVIVVKLYSSDIKPGYKFSNITLKNENIAENTSSNLNFYYANGEPVLEITASNEFRGQEFVFNFAPINYEIILADYSNGKVLFNSNENNLGVTVNITQSLEITGKADKGYYLNSAYIGDENNAENRLDSLIGDKDEVLDTYFLIDATNFEKLIINNAVLSSNNQYQVILTVSFEKRTYNLTVSTHQVQGFTNLSFVANSTLVVYAKNETTNEYEPFGENNGEFVFSYDISRGSCVANISNIPFKTKLNLEFRPSNEGVELSQDTPWLNSSGQKLGNDQELNLELIGNASIKVGVYYTTYSFDFKFIEGHAENTDAGSVSEYANKEYVIGDSFKFKINTNEGFEYQGCFIHTDEGEINLNNIFNFDPQDNTYSTAVLYPEKFAKYTENNVLTIYIEFVSIVVKFENLSSISSPTGLTTISVGGVSIASTDWAEIKIQYYNQITFVMYENQDLTRNDILLVSLTPKYKGLYFKYFYIDNTSSESKKLIYDSQDGLKNDDRQYNFMQDPSIKYFVNYNENNNTYILGLRLTSGMLGASKDGVISLYNIFEKNTYKLTKFSYNLISANIGMKLALSVNKTSTTASKDTEISNKTISFGDDVIIYYTFDDAANKALFKLTSIQVGSTTLKLDNNALVNNDGVKMLIPYVHTGTGMDPTAGKGDYVNYYFTQEMWNDLTSQNSTNFDIIINMTPVITINTKFEDGKYKFEQVYDGASHSLTVGSSSTNDIQYPSNIAGLSVIISYNGGNVLPKNVGNYDITLNVTWNEIQLEFNDKIVYVITPKHITLKYTGDTISKEYSGTSDVEVDKNKIEIDGLCGWDDLYINSDFLASFKDTAGNSVKDVGSKYNVYIYNLEIQGASIDNYVLDNNTITAVGKGQIYQAKITLTGYELSKSIVLSQNLSVEWFINGEKQNVNAISQDESKNFLLNLKYIDNDGEKIYDKVYIDVSRLSFKLEIQEVGKRKKILIDGFTIGDAISGEDAKNYSFIFKNSYVDVYPEELRYEVENVGTFIAKTGKAGSFDIDSKLYVEVYTTGMDMYNTVYSLIENQLSSTTILNYTFKAYIKTGNTIKQISSADNIYLIIPPVNNYSNTYLAGNTEGKVQDTTENEDGISVKLVNTISLFGITSTNNKLPIGLIIGIIVAGVLLVALFIIIFIIVRRKKQQEYSKNDKI